MANQIRIKISSRFCNPLHEACVMKRLHDCLGADKDGPFEKDSGYKWQLNASNDWWAELDYEKNELILAYRYGSYSERIYSNNPKHEALANWASFMFDI